MVVVATSTDETDDVVQGYCENIGVCCFRGFLEDVAGRFVSALQSCDFDAFVRVNADSPLLDQRLIDKGIDLFCSGNQDLVTNVWPQRTFPAGQSVEVIRTATFRQAYPLMTDPMDREHVTSYFYKYSNNFRIASFTSPVNLNGLHLSIDTPEDLRSFKAIIGQCRKPHWEYDLEEIVSIHKKMIGIKD
jgi:spore coat polysaccharide biosynthesis protein SpsF